MRPTLDEKVVTATRPEALVMTSARPSETCRSDGDSPSRIALVESQTSASTPSSPSARNRGSSVSGPSAGSVSFFQSPVCSTMPAGVRMASDTGSGMEWVTAIASISNGPIVKRWPPS